MKKNQKIFFTLCLFITSVSLAAISKKPAVSMSDAKTNIEKLTGVRTLNTKESIQSISAKALMLARKSRDEKNYVLAIKRYNYIIKNFSTTPEYVTALFDKSAIYKKMGFEQPAVYNFKKAQTLATVKNKTGSLKR